jgi:hypothetical protein
MYSELALSPSEANFPHTKQLLAIERGNALTLCYRA